MASRTLLLSALLLLVVDGLSLAAPSVKKVTLYRDSNGWCPFCEKVWVALREKDIPFEEVLIDLKDKPEWYTKMVPTTLVPAIELHDLNYDALTPGSGALTYDSAAVLKVLDEEFPDSRALLVKAEKGAEKTASATLMTTMFEVVASSRNETLTAAQKGEKLGAFESALAAFEAELASQDGTFIGGSEKLTTADLDLAPIMSRYRYQLPLLAEGAPLLYDPSKHPAMAKWFDGLQATPSFARRVAGDEYSWTAVTSTFMRIFANATDPIVIAKMANADAAAASLLDKAAADTASLDDKEARLEAAKKLAKNYQNVVADATNSNPKSQQHLPRATSAKQAAATLSLAHSLLLLGPNTDRDYYSTVDCSSKVARLVAARLCAPRDMGAPAARALRHVLMSIALELEKKQY